MEAIMTVMEYYTVDELMALAKSQSNSRLFRRIQAIALAQQGYSCPRILKITGACRRAVQSWVAKYNAHGIDGLKDKPRSGRRCKLTAAQLRRFQERIDAGVTQADGLASLNARAIRKILKREFHVLYSLTGVYELLHRLGYSCLMPRPRHENADPQEQERFKKIL